MNCHEAHIYWESHSPEGTIPAMSDPELLQHISLCQECAQFVEEQRKLRMQLCILRDAAPDISTTLDAAVLANYRNYISSPEPAGALRAKPKPARSVAIFAWAAAVSIAVIVAYAQIHLLLPVDHVPIPTAPQLAARPPLAISPQQAARKKEGRLQIASLAKPKHLRRATSQKGAVSEQEAASIPPAFQGLMYCDELSCSGAMQVIRVELPAPAMALGASAQPGGVVFADVLVGADGIARGIRIVQ